MLMSCRSCRRFAIFRRVMFGGGFETHRAHRFWTDWIFSSGFWRQGGSPPGMPSLPWHSD